MSIYSHKNRKRRSAGHRFGGLFLVFTLGILVILSMVLWTTLFPDKITGQKIETNPQKHVDTGFVVTNPGDYDSADTAILVKKNEEEQTLTFLNLKVNKKYTLSYDGTTRFYDKYGEGLALSQVEKGDVVDLTFLKSKKHLTTLQLSLSSWVIDQVEKYEVNSIKGEISIGGETYKINDQTQFVSGGNNIEIMDLSPKDVLKVVGIDTTVYSVIVKRGHGYLRLENDENFVGGWIEIGQSQVHQITDGMLLTVTEGLYQIAISHNGNSGIKQASIERNQETVLDIGDIEVAAPEKGTVLFSISPSTAELFVDGVKTEYAGPVSMEYGLHQLIVRNAGYQSITQYIRVGQPSAGVDITLEKIGEGEEEKPLEEEDTETDLSNGYYSVYVSAPVGAEVYLDGSYIGIAPCSFKKVPGAHMITLRKQGYLTRSYTVQIDEEERDLTLSFVDLISIDGNDNPSDTGSGNSGDKDNTGSGNSGDKDNTGSGNSGDNTGSGNSGDNTGSGNNGDNTGSGNSGDNTDSGSSGGGDENTDNGDSEDQNDIIPNDGFGNT